MNKEIANKWCEALRSGKYKQGKASLHDKITNTFCCLGVLCDLGYAIPAKNGDQYIDLEENIYGDIFSILKTNEGTYIQGTSSLADLNDSGKTFNEIADIIEQNWEKL